MSRTRNGSQVEVEFDNDDGVLDLVESTLKYGKLLHETSSKITVVYDDEECYKDAIHMIGSQVNYWRR